MLCQSCNSNPATVHVTEIVHPEITPESAEGSSAAPTIREQHLCATCAQGAKLPQMPAVLKKSIPELYQLLQASKRSRRESGIASP